MRAQKRNQVKAAVVITALGFQMVARAEKARKMARELFEAGIPVSDVARMTSTDWARLQRGLSAAGVLGRYSTPPSAETIERTLTELKALEARSAVFAARLAA